MSEENSIEVVDNADVHPAEQQPICQNPQHKKKKNVEHVIIRPYSDVVFLYPSIIIAILCGLWTLFATPENAQLAVTPLPGVIFSLCFFINLSVIAFDYSRLSLIVVGLLVVIAGLLTALFPDTVAQLFSDIVHLNIVMTPTFYWAWAVLILLTLLGVWVLARFDYYEVKNNELLHHHGFLGDTERWPSPNMRISKEINDVLAYVLLKSGRLVLIPPGSNRAIVVPNVISINKVEAQIQTLLSTLRVDDED